MRRTGPPSPTLTDTLLTLSLALALRGFRAVPGFLGLSRVSWLVSAFPMHECCHLFQVFSCMQLRFDLGDIGQFLASLQECFLDVVEMLDLMFNQSGDEPAGIVGALWRLGDL